MRCLRLARTLKGRSKVIALALVLCSSSVGRADKFPPGPVIEFRQALSLSLREYLPKDPELRAKIEKEPAEERKAYFKDARSSDLLHRMDMLKTIPDMRRALGAQEWREKGSEEQNEIDNGIR